MLTKELGTRIQELRKKTGLSQEKFALQIDMDRTYFASVEAGKRNIAIINIKKIALYASSLKNIRYYELLIYHPLGIGKAQALGYNPIQFEKPELSHINRLTKVARDIVSFPVAVNSVFRSD